MEREEYYSFTRHHPKVDNAAAIKRYFEETEPTESLPTNSRVLHLGKATSIAETMYARLIKDIIVNSRIGWEPGSALPGKDQLMQPLADGTPHQYTA